MMAALEVDHSAVAPQFENCDLVYVHCVFDEVSQIQMPFKIVTVNVRAAHVSLGSAPQKIVLAWVADRDWGADFQRFIAPKLIKVTSSCEFEFQYHLEDEDRFLDVTGVCIWEWEYIINVPPNITSGSQSTSPAPPNMPEIMAGDCQFCSPAVTSSPPSPAHDTSPLPSDTNDSGSDDDSEEELDAEIVKLKGCTLEKRYQDVLEVIREEMITRKNEVAVRLEFEPQNPADKNAIKIDAEVNNVWKIIGYIPVEKIPKFTRAIRKGEIVTVKLTQAPNYQIHPVQCGFGATIVVVKKGQWVRDDRNNVYNSNLSYL